MDLSEEEKELYKNMGNNLITIRGSQTQEEIAKIIGIKATNYNTIEAKKGERHLRDFQLIKLAKHYNTSTDYLLGLTNVKTPDITTKTICNEYGLTEESLNIIKAIKEGKTEEINISQNSFKKNVNAFPETAGINALICSGFVEEFSENYNSLIKLNICKTALMSFEYYKDKVIPNLNLKEKNNILDIYKRIINDTISYINTYLKNNTLLDISFDLSEVINQIEETKEDFSDEKISKLNDLFRLLRRGLLYYENTLKFEITDSCSALMIDLFENNFIEELDKYDK